MVGMQPQSPHPLFSSYDEAPMPGMYAFTAREIQAFAGAMDLYGCPLTKEQMRHLSSLVDFYESKAVVQ